MRVSFLGCGILRVFIDRYDLCFGCENKNKCPLIQVLENDQAVIRHQKVKIDNCNLYLKKRS